MFGSFTIHATQPEDLRELCGFLRTGFDAAEEEPLFGHALMHWKYFEPLGIAFGPRSFIARAGGKIVGHVGISPRTFFLEPGADGNAASVAALHFMDLLASPAHATAGLMLMKRGFQVTDAQYALGGSADGQRMARATGYECRFEFAVMTAILRPLYRLHESTRGPLGRLLRTAKDVHNYVTHPGKKPRQSLSLRPVEAFDDAIDRLLDPRVLTAVHTARSAATLNAYLRLPCGGMTGWTLHRGSELAGFAVLNVKSADSLRHGKIVECFLPSRDPETWHAALAALLQELHHRQADVASCFASTPWMVEACRSAGFVPRSEPEKFYLRDPKKRIPHDSLFHLTMLEADHAYL